MQLFKMKKIYLFSTVLAVQFVFAQNSQMYFSGLFFNDKKKPENFLKVFNKNSGIYERTDERGFAIIPAQLYDTLVWNNGKSQMIVTYDLRELKDILESNISRKSVDNLYNKDYTNLITKSKDSSNEIGDVEARLTKKSNSYFYKVRKIKQTSNSTFLVKQQEQYSLNLGGVFTTSVEGKSTNSLPHTQSRYVQGRSENGILAWKGPETEEMMSFGPDINTLQYNHLPYDYDFNGKLVPANNGSSPAKAYQNLLFKDVFSFSNQLSLNAALRRGYNELFKIMVDVGQTKNQLNFADEYDVSSNFKSKLKAQILKFNVELGYNYIDKKATNTNRIGLYNRVYQNSLLTPISFSNVQGKYLSNGNQRSYSKEADNPLFLLDREQKYNFTSKNRQFDFNINRNFGNITLNFTHSFGQEQESNIELYRKSTVGFAQGLHNIREQENRFNRSNFLASYKFGDYDFTNNFNLRFVLNDEKTNINHLLGDTYQYQRTAQDYIFNYNFDINTNADLKLGGSLGNSFYVSNTSKVNQYWLPKADAFLTFTDIFDWYNTKFTAFGAYTELSTEPNINQSYAQYATTNFNAKDSNRYFPIKEVNTFNNLATIDSKEWKVGFRLTTGRKISLDGEYFERKVENDVFPIFNNQNLELKNLANHTYSGYDFNFSYNNFELFYNVRSTQKVSFYKYQDIVDKVASGYNNLAIAGFKDVYKTLSQGNPLGVVVGSYFERDANGTLLIDDSGYPIKAKGEKIIANPTPDFVVKFNHSFIYEGINLSIDWEWKKGGQVWNGTQAVLDYYGRSQTSADQRNTKNYVFEGVNANGNPNSVAVDFYNANEDVNQNRWSRYGYLGVAESYVQKADHVKINSVTLTKSFRLEQSKQRLLDITLFVNNIMLWQAKSGADPNQSFYNMENGQGLDFFNLPSYKTFGCKFSFKF